MCRHWHSCSSNPERADQGLDQDRPPSMDLGYPFSHLAYQAPQHQDQDIYKTTQLELLSSCCQEPRSRKKFLIRILRGAHLQITVKHGLAEMTEANMSVRYRAQRMLKDLQYVCQFAETHFRETETRQLWSKGMFSALWPFPLPPCAKKSFHIL